MKTLKTFVEQINWWNDVVVCGNRDGTSSLRKAGKTVKSFCYGAISINEWIEPLEIEVLSRDEKFISK